MRQVNVYELRNPDGTVYDRGTAVELARRRYFLRDTILRDAERHQLLDGQYEVVKVGQQDSEVTEKNIRVLEHLQSGLSLKETAAAMGLPYGTVYGRYIKLRERGLIE